MNELITCLPIYDHLFVKWLETCRLVSFELLSRFDNLKKKKEKEREVSENARRIFARTRTLSATTFESTASMPPPSAAVMNSCVLYASSGHFFRRGNGGSKVGPETNHRGLLEIFRLGSTLRIVFRLTKKKKKKKRQRRDYTLRPFSTVLSLPDLSRGRDHSISTEKTTRFSFFFFLSYIRLCFSFPLFAARGGLEWPRERGSRHSLFQRAEIDFWLIKW